MRAHNERLVLSLIRHQGALSKSEIARITGLSAQTVSVIMRALEQEGMLARCAPVRGKVGQPSVPMRLDENGAFFLGLKIGRRSSEVVLIDFLGQQRGHEHISHAYPTPEATIAFARGAVERLIGGLSKKEVGRIAGLGVAIPFQLWNWAEAMGAPSDEIAAWRSCDIQAELEQHLDFAVYLQNDASCACGAELVFGTGASPRHFLYFYIGTFIGGGLVLDNGLYAGPTGNAGAFGSLLVPAGDGSARQLIEIASLSVLERALKAAGQDANLLWHKPQSWDFDDAIVADWIERVGQGLAYAVAAAAAVVDIDAAMIDGWIPAEIRQRLVTATAAALETLDMAGINPPRLQEGTIGPDARSLGAASLPLSDRFLIDKMSLAATD